MKSDLRMNDPKFEKVSRVSNLEFELPKRGTKGSAGYDFFAIEDVIIQPKETKLVKTGIKARMAEDMVLMLYLRSSSYKQELTMANNVGIVDSDYYNNPSNEGEIGFIIQNYGNLPVTIFKGNKLGQGIFVKYYTTVDDNVTAERVGGYGSTGR